MADSRGIDVQNSFAFTKGRMSPSLVESMLIRLLSHPGLFQEAKGILSPAHFESTESRFSAIWAAAVQCDDEFSRLTFETMSDRVEELLADAGEDVSPQQAEAIFGTDPDRPGLLYWSLSQVDPADVDLDQGRHLLRRFLEERVLADELRNALEFAPGGVPSNLPAIIERANQARERITNIQDDPVELGIPDNWEPESLDVWPTCLPFLDTPMDGGHARGEVYGILGPFGVGKTTLGIQLCVEQCRYWHDREVEYGEEGGQVFFFSYEQSATEVRRKAVACAARIHMSTMNTITGEDCFSTRSSLKDYETEMFRKSGLLSNGAPAPPGEQERYADVKEMLRRHLRIVDLSGGAKKRTGDGYVGEIAAILENSVRKHNAKPRMVCIDHVWLAAYRHLSSQGMDERRLRHFITMFGSLCRPSYPCRKSPSGTRFPAGCYTSITVMRIRPLRLSFFITPRPQSLLALPCPYLFAFALEIKISSLTPRRWSAPSGGDQEIHYRPQYLKLRGSFRHCLIELMPSLSSMIRFSLES